MWAAPKLEEFSKERQGGHRDALSRDRNMLVNMGRHEKVNRREKQDGAEPTRSRLNTLKWQEKLPF